MPGEPSTGDGLNTLRAALEVLVFAPLGLGAKLVDDAPAAVRGAKQELSNARFIGRLAVTQGVEQMRNSIESSATGPGPPTPDVSGGERSPASGASESTDDHPVPVEDRSSEVDVEPAGDVPDVDSLALPDYEHLPAIDVVAKLATLSVDDRDAIERYETAHRRRRTILGKLRQLADER